MFGCDADMVVKEIYPDIPIDAIDPNWEFLLFDPCASPFAAITTPYPLRSWYQHTNRIDLFKECVRCEASGTVVRHFQKIRCHPRITT